jgi:capsular polysaccharide transport system permease protein
MSEPQDNRRPPESGGALRSDQSVPPNALPEMPTSGSGPLTPTVVRAKGQGQAAVEATKRSPDAASATGQDSVIVPVAKRKLPNAPPREPRATPLRVWPDAVGHVELLSTMRRSRRRRFFGRFALFVGLPTLLVVLYVLLWATPRYVSEFEVTYQTFQPPQTLSSGLVQTLLGGTTTGGTVDPGAIIYEYIRSGTLLAKLDAKLHLRQYYSSKKIDYPFRLSADATDEMFLSYYRWHVVSVSEGMGGYLTVAVQAFDAKFTTALAQAIVQASDEMIDNMTARARGDEVRFAESELNRQEERVIRAAQALTRFQNIHGDLNPQAVANQLGQIAGGLETSLAQARTELTDSLTHSRPDSPQVVNIKSRIAALELQLRDQRNRLANSGDKSAYSQILDEYSRLQLEQEFAKNAYLSAQQGLAVARADAARKQSYLVDFVLPNQPDHPTFWISITYVATTFLGALLIYAVGSLIFGAFRDQAGL